MDRSVVEEEEDWIDVLGVSAQATINEVKHAYKLLIKQNHPDRVQDMSPAFRTLAEAEQKGSMRLIARRCSTLMRLSPWREAAFRWRKCAYAIRHSLGGTLSRNHKCQRERPGASGRGQLILWPDLSITTRSGYRPPKAPETNCQELLPNRHARVAMSKRCFCTT